MCVTATVPNLALALEDYCGRLGLKLVSENFVSQADAASWRADKVAGHKQAVLQHQSGAPSFIRLVEQPLPAGFRATSSYGWAAFELSVEDAFSWPDRLKGSGFNIVGPPRHITGLDHLIAMQMVGNGQEMVYLNEVRDDTPTTDLPRAKCPVDAAFICILAAHDRTAALRWYCDNLGLDENETHTIPYSSINRAFGLSDDHMTSLTMVHNKRMPIIEIDGYPGQTIKRPVEVGHLPPGNAIVTLGVADLDQITLAPLTPVRRVAAAPYLGRRTATYLGNEGELLELIDLVT
ncbi:MAG: hypothetical protein ABJ205_10615 [Erythrobacter sp.]|uniref:hypothetical protein n=1 Tax=Erythrobacter sp. TaxID=1042 RepID=UPI00329A2B22